MFHYGIAFQLNVLSTFPLAKSQATVRTLSRKPARAADDKVITLLHKRAIKERAAAHAIHTLSVDTHLYIFCLASFSFYCLAPSSKNSAALTHIYFLILPQTKTAPFTVVVERNPHGVI
jgi:hypothetical protein